LSLRSNPPPVPVGAELFGYVLQVTFSRELRNTSPDPANWSMSFSGTFYYADTVEIDRFAVLATMIPLGPDPGPNRCAYAAAPADIMDLDGTLAAAFDNFPLS
jgi:hypothetical protein